MSYNDYNNKYRGNNHQPKPRDIIETPGHELDPLVEIAIKNKSALNDYRGFGDVINSDTINFSHEGQHYSLPVFKFALMVEMQCGIPHDHPNYPRVHKLDTRFKSSKHYIEYSGPIKWLRDSTYVHIPGHTRYVINREGVIRNAYSGIEIEPNQWGTYSLVKDQATNKLRTVELNELKLLSFAPLPGDFIDYGFGTYSHIIDFEDKALRWCPRKKIIAKNLKDGSADEYPSTVHFANTVVSDFKARATIARLTEFELSKKMVTAGEFSVKLADYDYSRPQVDYTVQPKQDQATTKIEVPVQTQEQQQPMETSQSSDELFGDDFNF